MTDHRRNSVYAAAVCYPISAIFLLLVIIGNTSDKVGLRDIFFFRLNLANVIPTEAPNSRLLNSVARSLGLHDFYQVGLWNFCEGYNDEGIVYCSKPKRFYWFNPIQVLMDELLAGAQIALPSAVLTVLELLRLGSKIMFGLFITAIVLSTVMAPLSFLIFRSRIWCIPVVILSIVTMVCAVGGTILTTVFSLAAKYALTMQSELNISADISPLMLASAWIPALLTTAAFFLHSAVGCCCHIAPPRKADRKGEKGENGASEGSAEARVAEKEKEKEKKEKKKKKRFSVREFIDKTRSRRAASSAVSESHD